MKLVFLNIWGGRIFEPLMEFIKEQSATADVFCLQEVMDASLATTFLGSRTVIFKKLKSALPDFQPYFMPVGKAIISDAGKNIKVQFGIGMFIRKGIIVEEAKDFFLCDDGDDVGNYPKNGMYARLK